MGMLEDQFHEVRATLSHDVGEEPEGHLQSAVDATSSYVAERDEGLAIVMIHCTSALVEALMRVRDAIERSAAK